MPGTEAATRLAADLPKMAVGARRQPVKCRCVYYSCRVGFGPPVSAGAASRAAAALVRLQAIAPLHPELNQTLIYMYCRLIHRSVAM